MDYNILSQDYDLTRSVNIDVVRRIITKADIGVNSYVLDFGCGTGNYAYAIKKITNANVFGVEPLDGMREKAQEKCIDIQLKKGDHTFIPFEDVLFDLIYMTDVIHHIPDLHTMFTQFYKALKQGGKVCILTESHQQIETRFWSAYFPATVAVEKERYPDIPSVITIAKECRFTVDEKIITDCEQHFEISSGFINLVENKGYSMFRLISDENFEHGLQRLKRDYENKILINTNHGETILWLKKT